MRWMVDVSVWVVFIFGLLSMLVCVIEYFGGMAMMSYAVPGAIGAGALFLSVIMTSVGEKVK